MSKVIQAQLIQYLKVVQGSFNQTNQTFGCTAGRQCACITLFSIACSVIRRVGLWILRVFEFFILILTLYVNMNMSFIKLMSLLIDGDAESNAGPIYTILKVVQGSFNQANQKFGCTADTQCVCITLFSITWSAIRRVGLWNTSDFDFILNEGDKLCKGLNICTYISADQLPQTIDIDNNVVYVEKLRLLQGTIMKHANKN